MLKTEFVSRSIKFGFLTEQIASKIAQKIKFDQKT